MMFHSRSDATVSAGSVAQRSDVSDDVTFLRQRQRKQIASQSVAGGQDGDVRGADEGLTDVLFLVNRRKSFTQPEPSDYRPADF